jgi:Tol biopolymer transport system component
MNITGGEARQLTQCTNGASNPVWSPDGRKLAFNVSIKPDEEVDAADKQEKKNEKPVPLEIDKMKHKSDAQGFWSGRYSQVAVVDIRLKTSQENS